VLEAREAPNKLIGKTELSNTGEKYRKGKTRLPRWAGRLKQEND